MESWRLIRDEPLEGAMNMAVDEALLAALEDGSVERPTLRLYGWKEPTISLGYLQDASPFLGTGLPIVRRITGGRAVLHLTELTYSIIAPIGHPLFSEGILAAYSVISTCIINALRSAGISAEFSRGSSRREPGRSACFHTPSRFEVLVGGKKLVGSSQRRFKAAFLQHGSILFGLDAQLNEKVFGPDVVGRMAAFSPYSPIGKDEFAGLLADEFAKGLGAVFTVGALTAEEEALKTSLLGSKYSKDEWNIRGGREEAVRARV